ncbi:MAG: Ig domain-containing protein, partial [Rhodospirillaceae bacterium]|nr:Ig domain-containing protein [Rhodospirillaceae bacterium]
MQLDGLSVSGILSSMVREWFATRGWKPIGCVIPVCIALSLAACGGGGELSIGLQEGTSQQTLELDFPPEQVVQHPLPFRISGGVPPYVSSIEGCPDWVTLFPDQGILAGTAPASDNGRTFLCTDVVTDSASFSDPQTKSFLLRLDVKSPRALFLPSAPDQAFIIGAFSSVTLRGASGGVQPYTYSFTCAGGALPSGMGFAPATRVLAGT